MIRTAYETTSCKKHILAEVLSEIGKAQVMNGSALIRPPFNGGFYQNLWMITPLATNVPQFGHPIVGVSTHPGVEDIRTYKGSSLPRHDVNVYIDARPFTKINRQDEKVVVTDQVAAEFALTRGALSYHWVMEHKEDILNLGSMQISVYTSWLISQLNRRLNLEGEAQLRAMVLMTIFYLSLFHEGETFSESEMVRIRQTVFRTHRHLPTDMVAQMTENHKTIRDLPELIERLKSDGGSIRFQELSAPLIYAIVGNNWMGANSREMVCVALEHPPTFVALIHTAINSRLVRKTVLGSIVVDSIPVAQLKSFSVGVEHLLRGQISS